MKILLKFCAITCLMLATPSLYAKNYYVCDTGSDDSMGETIDNPMKTFDKAVSNFRYLGAGDTISFCRGGKFPVSNYGALYNTNFTADNPMVIGDYYAPGARGNESRPILTNSEAGIFYFNTRKTDIPDGGLVIENLILKGNGKSRGIFFLNGFSDVEIRNVVIDGFRVGASIGGGEHETNNFVLKDSIIKNNTEQGWMGGGSNFVMENNSFQNNGFGGSRFSYYYHNLYFSNSSSQPSVNVIFRGNTLYQSAMVDGKCGGASIVVHGKVKRLLIENNTVKEDKGAVSQFCYGMGVGPAYSYGEYFYDVTVRNNKIINTGRVGFHGGSLVNAIIENNYIIDEGEILDEGIVIQDTKRNSDDAESNNVRISGNTIVVNNIYAKGITIGGESPFVANNNKISLNVNSYDGKCFKKIFANTDTDTSSNSCNSHEKTSDVINVIDLLSGSNVQVSIEADNSMQSYESTQQTVAAVKLAQEQAAAALESERIAQYNNDKLAAEAIAAEAERVAQVARDNAVEAAELARQAEETVSLEIDSTLNTTSTLEAFRAAEAVAIAKAAEAVAAANSSAQVADEFNGNRKMLGSFKRSAGSNTVRAITLSDVNRFESRVTNDPEACRASAAGVCLLK